MIVNPWFWLGGLLMLIAAGLAGTRVGIKLEAYKLADYKKEVAEAQAAAQKRAFDQLRKNEVQMSALDTALQKARKENDELKLADRRRALAGDLRLRVPGGCVRPPEDVSDTVGKRNAGAASEGFLPPAVTADLFDLANTADALSEQLRTCQSVIRTDRS